METSSLRSTSKTPQMLVSPVYDTVITDGHVTPMKSLCRHGYRVCDGIKDPREQFSLSSAIISTEDIVYRCSPQGVVYRKNLRMGSMTSPNWDI